MRCWFCGTEPIYEEAVVWWGGANVLIPCWPAATDHPHAEHPPSPGELLAAGCRAADRIQEILAE